MVVVVVIIIIIDDNSNSKFLTPLMSEVGRKQEVEGNP